MQKEDGPGLLRIEYDDTATTCGLEAWAYCQNCNRGVIYLCVNGLISCPICCTPEQWCPQCSDGEMYEVVLDEDCVCEDCSGSGDAPEE